MQGLNTLEISLIGRISRLYYIVVIWHQYVIYWNATSTSKVHFWMKEKDDFSETSRFLSEQLFVGNLHLSTTNTVLFFTHHMLTD